MDMEDLEPRRKAPTLRELDTLSIGELKDHLTPGYPRYPPETRP